MSVWPAIIGALSVLSGVFITSKLDEKRWGKQISYEREKEKSKVLREKGEELHSLISRWQKYIGIHHFGQLSVLEGKISESQRDEIAIKNQLEDGLHDRLETLLLVYFSELEPSYSGVKKSLENANGFYGLAQKKTMKHIDLMFNQTTVDIQRELQSINEAIREKLKG
jgi:hypothetical protein